MFLCWKWFTFFSDNFYLKYIFLSVSYLHRLYFKVRSTSHRDTIVYICQPQHGPVVLIRWRLHSGSGRRWLHPLWRHVGSQCCSWPRGCPPSPLGQSGWEFRFSSPPSGTTETGQSQNICPDTQHCFSSTQLHIRLKNKQKKKTPHIKVWFIVSVYGLSCCQIWWT